MDSSSDDEGELRRKIAKRIRHPMGVFGTLEDLKGRIVGLEPVPAYPLQLAPGVQGGRGPVTRVQIDNRHVLLCSLVASEPARLSADPDIRSLYRINDKLVPISERVAADFQQRLARASELVRALVETLEGDETVVDRILEAEAVVGAIATAYKAPVLPDVAVPLKDAVRHLTSTPDNHGDELHAYSSNYWLLRVWHAICGGSDLERTVSKKIKVVINGFRSAIAKVRSAVNLPAPRGSPLLPDLSALRSEAARFCGDLKSVYSLLGEVGFDSHLLAPHRAAALQKAQQLRREILTLDIDVIASEEIKGAKTERLVGLMAKRAAERRKNDRARLLDGRNPLLDEEFEIRKEVDAALSKPAVLEALEARRKKIAEVGFKDPMFTEQHERQLEAEPVVEEVQAALDAISHLDARIERFVRGGLDAAAFADFQKRRLDTIAGFTHTNLRAAFAHQPRLSKDDMVRLVMDKLGDAALCESIRSMPDIVVETPPLPDLGRLKLDLLTGLSDLVLPGEGACPARELFYMQKRGQKLVDGEGNAITLPSKVRSALLKRAKAREAADERLRPLCSDPAIVARFESRVTKTDEQFADPLLVLEDMYTDIGDSLDNAVKKAIQADMTSSRPYFLLLADDFSLPGADLEKVQSGSFSLSAKRFSELFANKKSLTALRADKLERYWILTAFAGGRTDTACLMGRRHPHNDPHREAALRKRLELLSSRVGSVPDEVGIDIPREATPALRKLVRSLPGRMNDCVGQAVKESAFGGDLAFLLEVDRLMGRAPPTWVGFDFSSEACLPQLAEAALCFLGAAPGEITPTELTWSALAEGPDMSPDKMFALVRWGQPSDGRGWSFSASRPKAGEVGAVDMSGDRFVTETDLFGS